MTVRQAIALAASTLILHLGFVARESRCIPGHEVPKQAPVPAGHHQEHSQQQSAQTIPVCCEALTSCAVTVDVTSPGATAFGSPTTGRDLSAVPTFPISRTAAPEAPPPKA